MIWPFTLFRRNRPKPFTKCLDCGCKKFRHGPGGGVAQNIKCANPKCGSEYNIFYVPGGPFLDMRISEPMPDKEK